MAGPSQGPRDDVRRARKAIENPWPLGLVYFDPDNSDPTFVIEPDLGSIRKPELWSLQRDVRVIAEGLEPGVRGRARDSLVRIKNRSAAPPCLPSPDNS